MKKCITCKKGKNLEEFSIDKRIFGGYKNYCRECGNEKARIKFNRLFYGQGRQRILIAAKKFRENNPEKVRRSLKKCRTQIREEVINFYSNNDPKCACCGEKEFAFLSIDHIHNDGAKDRNTRGTGSNLYRSLKRENFPRGFQILCHNCNMAKGFYGQCPHSIYLKIPTPFIGGKSMVV